MSSTVPIAAGRPWRERTERIYQRGGFATQSVSRSGTGSTESTAPSIESCSARTAVNHVLGRSDGARCATPSTAISRGDGLPDHALNVGSRSLADGTPSGPPVTAATLTLNEPPSGKPGSVMADTTRTVRGPGATVVNTSRSAGSRCLSATTTPARYVARRPAAPTPLTIPGPRPSTTSSLCLSGAATSGTTFSVPMLSVTASRTTAAAAMMPPRCWARIWLHKWHRGGTKT